MEEEKLNKALKPQLEKVHGGGLLLLRIDSKQSQLNKIL